MVVTRRRTNIYQKILTPLHNATETVAPCSCPWSWGEQWLSQTNMCKAPAKMHTRSIWLGMLLDLVLTSLISTGLLSFYNPYVYSISVNSHYNPVFLLFYRRTEAVWDGARDRQVWQESDLSPSPSRICCQLCDAGPPFPLLHVHKSSHFRVF